MTLLAAPRAPSAVPSAMATPVAVRRSATTAVLVCLGVALATLPSLAASVDDLRYGAALAELGLLPYAALALLLLAALRHPWAAQLRPGTADVLVAAAALLAAAAVLLVGPVALDNLAYAVRTDLLAVPLVLLAGVCLLFGVRAVVAFPVPLLAALVAWPLPWRALLTPAVGAVEGLTRAALDSLVTAAPWLARRVPVDGDLRLRVDGPGDPFDLVVATPCSGATGMTAVVLTGLVLQYVLHGRPRARATWLLTALVAAFAANLLRLTLLLLVGRVAGERVALDVVHPVAGLVLLNLLLAGLLGGSERFGLRLGLRPEVSGGTPLTAPAPRADRMAAPVLLRRATALLVACGVLACLGTGVGSTRSAFAGPLPAAEAFGSAPYGVEGLTVTSAQEQRWAQRYYGEGSRWTRYRLRPQAASLGFSVWLDAVATPGWAPLRAHPVLDCYRFHGFTLVSVRRPELPGGLLADEVVYRDDEGATWHVLSWTWAVRDAARGLSLERVTLLASSRRTDLPRTDPGGSPTGARARLASVWGAATTGTDPNPGLSSGLRRTAGSLIASHLDRDLS